MVPAAWAATLALAFAAEPRELPAAHPRPVADLAFTPDGRGLVATDGDGTVARWDLAAGTPARLTRLGPFPTHAAPQFAVAPGGRHVAVGSSSDPPRVFDSATGRVVATLPRPLPDADAWYPAFADDGKHVAFGFDRGHGSPHPGPAAVPVWDVAAGRAAGTVELPLPPGGIVTARLALSADGAKLAAVITPAPANQGSGTELGVWDVATGKRVATHLLPTGPVPALAFLPDGRSLLVGTATGLAVWDSAADRWRHAAARSGEQFGPPALSPDGRTVLVPVVSRGFAQQALQRYAVVETATLRERVPLPRSVRDVELYDGWVGAFRPDGRVVAVARGVKVRLTDLAATGSTREWTNDPAELWAALAGPAPHAGAAVWSLVRRPDVALALFRDKLPPAPDAAPDAATTAGLIRQLDAAAFADRESARTRLAAVARLVEPELRSAHAASGSPEQKERLAGLLAAVDKLTPEELRQVRAVEVLEKIGTPAGTAVVRKLASGAENAVLTREAKLTLSRQAR